MLCQSLDASLNNSPARRLPISLSTTLDLQRKYGFVEAIGDGEAYCDERMPREFVGVAVEEGGFGCGGAGMVMGILRLRLRLRIRAGGGSERDEYLGGKGKGRGKSSLVDPEA